MDWREIKATTWGEYFKRDIRKRTMTFFHMVHELVFSSHDLRSGKHEIIVNEDEESRELWKWAGCSLVHK